MLSPETLFTIASTIVLPGWLALALAPQRRALLVMVARLLGAVLAGLYVSLLVAGLTGPGLPAGASFNSLAGVRVLLGSDQGLLAGWVHYLVFDLWVGSWIVENAPQHGIPHIAVLPCLLLTFLAGPTGLLLYLIIRTGWERRAK
jgi:hypothetical protein